MNACPRMRLFFLATISAISPKAENSTYSAYFKSQLGGGYTLGLDLLVHIVDVESLLGWVLTTTLLLVLRLVVHRLLHSLVYKLIFEKWSW
jgi:hypothetical protein